MSELLPPTRRALRARAHHLLPVVAIGQHGLTPAVLHEIDVALLKHELIKVRVASEQRATRDALLSLICKEIECAAVQHLGRIFVLYRDNPDAAKKAAKPDTRSVKQTGAGKPVKLKTGARTPLDPVRERRRATQAGLPASGKGRRGAARHQPSDAVVSDASRAAGAADDDDRRRPARMFKAAREGKSTAAAASKVTRSRADTFSGRGKSAVERQSGAGRTPTPTGRRRAK